MKNNNNGKYSVSLSDAEYKAFSSYMQCSTDEKEYLLQRALDRIGEELHQLNFNMYLLIVSIPLFVLLLILAIQ